MSVNLLADLITPELLAEYRRRVADSKLAYGWLIRHYDEHVQIAQDRGEDLARYRFTVVGVLNQLILNRELYPPMPGMLTKALHDRWGSDLDSSRGRQLRKGWHLFLRSMMQAEPYPSPRFHIFINSMAFPRKQRR